MSEEIQVEEVGLLNQFKSNKLLVVVFAIVLIGILGTAAYLGIKSYKEKRNIESAEAYSTDIFLMNDSTDVTDNLSAAADEYEGYNGGSIASFVLARKLMDKGEFEEAISELQRVEVEDIYVTAFSKGLLGDCHSEMENYDQAYTAYMEAANHEANAYSSAKFLMKAGLAAEALNNYEQAYTCYKQIKDDYPTSMEARSIDKEISRTENLK